MLTQPESVTGLFRLPKDGMYDRERYLANRERLCAESRAYRAANPEKIRAYKQRTSAKQREYRRNWEQANPEKAKENARRKNARKPDAQKCRKQRHLALVRHAPGDGVTRAQWNELKDEYGGRCAYCASDEPLEMEHVDPVSKGGAHDIENVVPACRRCNASKNDSTLIVWLALRAS